MKLEEEPVAPSSDKPNLVRVFFNQNHVYTSFIREHIVIFDYKITPRVQLSNDKQLQEIWKKVEMRVFKNIHLPVYRKNVLYSTKLPKEPLIVLDDDEYDKEYTVEIRQRKVYSVKNQEELLMFLNHSLQGIMERVSFSKIGNNEYFTPEKFEEIRSHKIYQGFSATFQEFRGEIILRVDIARKLVRKDRVLEAINKLQKSSQGKSQQEIQKEVKNTLSKKIVITQYGKGRFYKIVDVQYQPMKDVYISNTKQNLIEYYERKYDIKIKHKCQPLLVVENIRREHSDDKEEEPTFIIPELCSFVVDCEEFDSMERKIMDQALNLSSCWRKHEVEFLIIKMQESLEIAALEQLGVYIDRNFRHVDAKTIPKPQIDINKPDHLIRVEDFQLYQMLNPGKGLKICIVYREQASVGVKRMNNTFADTCSIISEVSLNSQEIKVPMQTEEDVIAGVEKALSLHDESYLILVILPDHLKKSYPRIKQYLLSAQAGKEMTNQIVVESTLKRKVVQSIHVQILQQMLVKRGAILWVPSCSEETRTKMSNVCIMGLDSYSNGINIMAGCCTLDKNFSRIHSSVQKFEDYHQEEAIFKITLDCLEFYTQCNDNKKPKELVLFVFAVSGIQANLVNLVSELEKQIKVTIIRINLSNKFFFFDDRGKNVPPGTLIDKLIVNNNYDFSIISQESTKEKTTPTQYKVIYRSEQSKLEEGHLQELIFSQCFNYCNWTGSIKIPAVLQYTKKCARFNCEVMEGKEVGSRVASTVYYI